jgi:hypothetical protein
MLTTGMFVCGRRLLVPMLLAGVAFAGEQFTRVHSFDAPQILETSLHRGGLDPGLTLTVVRGGVDGVPAATDGERLLQLSFADETDRKIEFGFQINNPQSAYSLVGEIAVLVDVFIATPTAVPGLMGIYSANWNPPSAWQGAVAPPAIVGQWVTVRVPLSGQAQTDETWFGALIFENLAGDTGVIYVDHLRTVRTAPTPAPDGVATLGLADRNEVTWNPVRDEALQGYHVYGGDAAGGPFTRLTTQPLTERHFVEPGPHPATRFYQVTAVTPAGESPPSAPTPAQYNGLTDDYLLDLIQFTTFNYFWLRAHPVSGLTTEPWDADKVAIGGSGMGLMAIIVGAERGWVSRPAAADRIRQMLAFLEDETDRFYGAWPHVADGTTGDAHTFSQYDDGADLVETAFVAQGLLAVRQYFDDSADPVETEIRIRATRMWESIDWTWFRRYPDSLVLWWHWSPNYGWTMDLPIRGYHEAMIVYLLAIASPTHPMPPESFYQGWCSRPQYANGETYYGIVQDVSEPLGGPLFFTHYSALGFDPRFKRDAYTNYFRTGRALSQIHRAYAIDNPRGFVGYNRWLWGLTASMGPTQYLPHSPTLDNGTIAPTAALSAMPYTPSESMQTLRYLYDEYGPQLGAGGLGFYDALNPTLSWFASDYISIDQGPIIVMIENHRTGLLWRLFMQNPEIRPMLDAIGFVYEPDLNHDGLLDGQDALLALPLVGGPDVMAPGDPEAATACDRDEDGDVDTADLAVLQQMAP